MSCDVCGKSWGPAYRAALDNVGADFGSNGNVSAEGRAALRALCAGGVSADRMDKGCLNVIRQLHSPNPDAHAPTRNASGPFFRAVTPDEFLRYHLGGAAKTEGERELDLRAAIDRASAAFGRGEIRRVPRVVMQGATGRRDSPTWWTIDPPLATTESGKTWFSGIALHENALPSARRKGLTLLSVGSLPVPLHKPTAFDGFCANSPFYPELTGKPHGLTKPRPIDGATGPAFKEFVSRSFSYSEIRERFIIATHLPW